MLLDIVSTGDSPLRAQPVTGLISFEASHLWPNWLVAIRARVVKRSCSSVLFRHFDTSSQNIEIKLQLNAENRDHPRQKVTNSAH